MLPWQTVVVILVPMLLHLLMGNFVEPQLFGRQFSMSPVVLLFSLGLWFILWGLAGAVLAIPLTSILRIVASFLMHNGMGLPYTAVFCQLLEGRPMDFASSGPSDTQRAEAEEFEVPPATAP